MDLQVNIEKKLRAGARRFSLRARFETSEDCVVLFGPSGSGKTLTLRAIAGLLRPDAGVIRVGDRVWFDSARGIDEPARRRGVGYLLQDYALFPHLTVEQNIGFGLRPWWRRSWEPAARARIDELLEVFGLRNLACALPADVSGGQRQRVGLARALACNPGLLLLDEPFAALDQGLRVKLRANLKAVHEHFRVPAILISHDPEDVEALADTLVVYEDGQVRKVWPFRSICQRRKVARYVRSQFGPALRPSSHLGTPT